METVKIYLTVLLAAFVLFSAGVHGLELREGPISQAMRAELSQNSWRASMSGPFKVDEDADQPVSTFNHAQPGQKSLVRAGLLSAVLPGAGQFYVGDKKSARIFFAADIVTWIGYLSFKTYANWKEDDYVRYAAIHANAVIDGKSKEFIDLVGFYTDINEYNRLGRAFDPEREYLFDTPENHWRWKSEAEQYQFRDLKNRSREADRRADFMIGVAIVDRVIAVIDAVRGARRANNRLGGSFSGEEQPTYKFSVNPFSSRNQIKLTLYPGF